MALIIGGAFLVAIAIGGYLIGEWARAPTQPARKENKS